MSDDERAEALGAKIGGRIDGPDWWCADCGAAGIASTEPEATKALYLHRQAVGHDHRKDTP